MRVTSAVWFRQCLLLVILLHVGARKHVKRKPLKITWERFKSAVTANKFPPPSKEQYRGFVHSLNYAGIKNEREAAMYLAQLLHESGGLHYKQELAYKDKSYDPYKSDLDVPGKRYFGRGYIQLTWAENYLNASRGIYKDDRLLQNPDLVANDEKAAFLTAGWYWKTRVAVVPGVKKGRFGEATRAITGVIECNGNYLKSSKKRFKYYKVIFHKFGAKGRPDERGCYN
ncbi:uncharacterized protein [Halyomorpha halys]|uniref:uncharacterized protein n=1 Tax=Halyomorpha halys TaxID=286706 RepID=UPI0006D4C9F5|nr:endochitinase At2g43620-like [Halyomorpha halys]XP_014279389.1 endochitinase At2g43620-like [Halyomorpha halys]XP_014279391.1 endochitinase At2g43620-like [Halyomorpha halys]